MPRPRLITLIALIAATSVASAQQPKRRSDRELQQFLGPVKSVHTVQTYQRADEPARDMGISDFTFNPDGSRAGMAHFAADGSPISKVVFRHDSPDGTVTEEATDYRGPNAGRRVTTRDDHNRPREIETYNLDGTLRDRVVFQFSPDGNREIHYDSAGQIISDVTRHMTRSVAPDGTWKTQAITSDGVVVAQTGSKRVGDTLETDSFNMTPQGELHHKTFRDANGTRNVQTGPNGRTDAYATDPSGQIFTSIHNLPDGNQECIVRHMDSGRRTTGMEVYQADVLTHRQVVTYEDDAQGNWIKMVNRQESAAGEMQVIETTTRTITYY